MSFSVVISTLNRTNEPLQMLKSLQKQTFKDFEVIVIDQNKDDFLSAHFQKFKDLELYHIHTSKKGASNARNIGIKKAKNEIITFPDDDCEFYPTFLEDIENYFSKNGDDAIVVTSKDKFDGKAISVLMSSKGQLINRKNVLKTVVEFGIIIKRNKLGNLLFDDKMGVGSEKSSYWSDEGPDFVLRGINKGIQFRFCPQFFMYHPNPVKVYSEKTTLRSLRYGRGRGYFLKKHNYGYLSICYYLFIYVVGMLKGIVYLNPQMFNYFKKGFKGRYEGYFLSKL